MANSRLEEIKKIRLEKTKKLREMGIDPYPAKVPGNPFPIKKARSQKTGTVEIVGRIWGWRGHGDIIFADLKDETGQVQLWFQKENIGERVKELKLYDVGDFLYAKGELTKTKAGELTVDVTDFTLLTKSIRPIPSTWHGLKDEEERYRQRYVDLMLDDDLKEMFRKKSVFWNSMRTFLINKGFLEVETPILENTAGGADANPFITHHNALDIDLYLRISMGELWQKRLMVGGFEKTFEIGRQFRNEGISREHLQDYTQMEFYWAYANHEDSMALVEEMLKVVVKETFGTLKFTINGMKVDLSKDWERIDYYDTIKEKAGVDISKAKIADLREKLRELKVQFKPSDSRGRLIDLIWKKVRKDIVGPAYLVGHPVEVSPLAKRMKDRPGYTERYQLMIAGSELCNGYSELNDPVDQARRFEEQQEMRDDGDAEAQMHDRDFVRALEYGMPPVTGLGISERLFAFLADKPIRETVLFPLLRPESGTSGTGKYNYRERKIVAILSKDLPSGLATNALGHMAFSAGHYSDESWMGEKVLKDADGVSHTGISRYPFVVLGAKPSEINTLVKNAKNNSDLLVVDYPQEMFDTGDDNELVKAVSKAKNNKMKNHAVLLVGNTKEVDKLTKDLELYK